VRDEHRLGTLEMGIRRHDCVARGPRLFDKLERSCRKMCQQNMAAGPNVQAQIGCDLLVAAASGM
jgi:hypothetical protein